MRRCLAGRLDAARALGVGAALLAAWLALPGRAWADESLGASGSLTYTWHGDPARGCAAEGLCGVEGAVIVEAQGQADASPFGGRTNINLFPSATTVRVLDGEGGATGECVDTPPNGPGDVFIGREEHGRLLAQVEPPISGGRCAGPLPQDLAGIRLAVRKTGGRRPSFDLRGNQPFVAGPFSGTLVSTMVFRPSSSGVTRSSSSGSSAGPPRRRKELIEQVMLRYSVSSLPGTLETSFSGEPDPFCAALDSCGAGGTLGLSLSQLHSQLALSASRVVPARVSPRRAIADLRRGRLRLIGGAEVRVGTQVTEAFSGGDGLTCHDSLSGNQAWLLSEFPGPGGGERVTLAEQPQTQSLLRTHCPGPTDIDVIGNFGVLAHGTVSVADLLERHIDVSLTNPGDFSGVGYVGSRGGAIGVSLTLEQFHAGTISAERR